MWNMLHLVSVLCHFLITPYAKLGWTWMIQQIIIHNNLIFSLASFLMTLKK